MFEDFDNYEDDSKFVYIYNLIKNKHSERLKEIRNKSVKKYIRQFVFTVVVIHLIFLVLMFLVRMAVGEFRFGFDYYPAYMVVMTLLVVSILAGDITNPKGSVKDNELFKYFNEKMLNDLTKGVSDSIEHDNNVEDKLYNEFHENFDKDMRKSFYIVNNHFFGKYNGLGVDAFSLIEDTGYKKYVLNIGYIYSSTTLRNKIENEINISNKDLRNINTTNEKLKRVVEEYSKFFRRFRIKIHENKLMIAIDTDLEFYPYSTEQALDGYFLYRQYKLIKLTMKITESVYNAMI